jgi:hypothetical protein
LATSFSLGEKTRQRPNRCARGQRRQERTKSGTSVLGLKNKKRPSHSGEPPNPLNLFHYLERARRIERPTLTLATCILLAKIGRISGIPADIGNERIAN